MPVKPQITLLFLLSVFTVLLLLATVIPDEGIPWGKAKIRFATLEDIFSLQPVEYADIHTIIEQNKAAVDSVGRADKIPEEEPWDTVRADAGSLKQRVAKLQFYQNDRSILYGAFRAMEQARQGAQPVRILHYGDSQIEGDRITSFLRNRLLV